MGDSKRWTVTYTKHIKQKRKVYQDGALEHHNNKVMLYDDSGKVIDSRFLKKDEVVRYGETLTFDSYLVDIGDPEGNHETLKVLNVQGRDKKSVENISTLNGFKKADSGNIGTLRDRTLHEDKKSELHNFRAPQSRLNTIKINDRGSKQYGPQNFEASKNCSNPTQTTAREWHALYTTQVTQKAKKYHDGFIRLEFCGSHQKQVVLYDASRKVLDSRFLKKDEVVRSGETVVFDIHLVDVGEPEGNDYPLTNFRWSRKNEVVDLLNSIPKLLNVVQFYIVIIIIVSILGSSLDSTAVITSKSADIMAGEGSVKLSRENEDNDLVIFEAQQNPSNLMQDKIREWHALYTTQVTQKAKKYHDGILQLAVCVSHRKQVILLNEDGTTLSRKYLNSSEDVKTGCTLQVTNYLVEIGEPKISQGGESRSDACSGKHVTVGVYSSRFSVDKIKLSPGDARKKPIRDGQSKDDASFGKHVGSYSSSFSVDKIKFCPSDAGNKPIRDVHQILFTLKKPMAPESLAPSRKPPMEQIFSSRSSDSSQFGLEEKLHGHNTQEPKSLRRNAVDDHEDNCGHLNGDSYSQMGCYRSVISESKVPQHLPTSGIVNLIDPQHTDVLDSNATLSNVSLGVAAFDIPTPKSDVGDPDKSMANSYPSVVEPQDSDAVLLDLPDKTTAISYPSVAEPQDSDVVIFDLPGKITANSYPFDPEPQVSDVALDLPDKITVNPFSSVAGPQVSYVLLDSLEDTRAEGSGGKGSGCAQDVKEENSNQISADKMATDNRLELEGGLPLGLSSTIDAALDSPNDVGRESCEVFKIIPEEKMDMDEFPSFDLGF
ncbi:protein of unknown function DUF2439 [Macleaya cordata]|uniref:5'-3' DNA helicase ZGRF1-like N-terminal domain-containing protein n=1 Tax=Macleaya cordata TaxID=56857 RepID=A0A200QCX5_MACCD|nr:protein of unknown function DUF2439 [Macleaya cordata]